MSGECQTTWIPLFEDLESRRRKLHDGETSCNLALTVNCESEFHGATKPLLEKEIYPERIVTRLCNTYDKIDQFATRIEEAQGFESGMAHRLIWASSIMTIKCGVKAGLSFDEVTKFVTKLNECVPEFKNPTASDYPDEENVQTPLQDIYREYIICHLSFVATVHEQTHSELAPQQLNSWYHEYLNRETTKAARAFKKAEKEHGHTAKHAKEKIQLRSRKGVVMPAKSSSLNDGNPQGLPTQVLESQFEYLRWLGNGTYGQVLEVRESSTNMFYACKQVRPDGDPNKNDDVMNEVKIMRRLSHPHIATVSLVVKEPDPGPYNIIMLPLADMNLQKYLEQCTDNHYAGREVKRLYSWFGSLTSALEYAHSKKIVHRDVKPANVLVKNHWPFLSDFGSARDFTGQNTSKTENAAIHGTPMYLAPESENFKSHGQPADVFALGAVFAEMLTVCHGRSLEEFREHRKVSDDKGHAKYAFRDTGEGVLTWLENFKGENILSNKVVGEITDMLIEIWQHRAEASDVFDRLNEYRAFFCRREYNNE